MADTQPVFSSALTKGELRQVSCLTRRLMTRQGFFQPAHSYRSWTGNLYTELVFLFFPFEAYQAMTCRISLAADALVNCLKQLPMYSITAQPVGECSSGVMTRF